MFHNPSAGLRKLIPIVPLSILCLSLAARTTEAAFSEIGFALNLSCKEMVLENPGDMMVMKYSAWDTPTQRIADNNMPFLELTNDATSDAPITEFNMTIGDTRFHFSDVYFGDYIKLGDSTPGFDLQASTEDNEDLLKVQILNGGLLPGQTVRFRVDIGLDPGFPDLFPHQDYRLTFFQMNGSDPSNNSIVTAVFSEAGMTQSVSAQLDDYPSQNGAYVNNNIRPYSVMEGIDVFHLSAKIPEPSSIVLLGMGGLAGLAYGVHRRRR